MNQQDEHKGIEDKGGKRPYTKPTLVEHGAISKLIQTGSGSGADGGLISGMMMVCL